jgi:hypothetical protein
VRLDSADDIVNEIPPALNLNLEQRESETHNVNDNIVPVTGIHNGRLRTNELIQVFDLA